jgi:hypothetical protein
MRIDAKMLIAKNACAEHVAIFEGEWPNGVHVTREVCDRALELGLNLSWFACKFLSFTARRAYKLATATQRAAFWQATSTTQKATAAAYWQATSTALWTVICEMETGD